MGKTRVYDVAIPILILFNATIFLVSHYLPSTHVFFEEHFVCTRSAIIDHRYWTILLSMFYHQSFTHLAVSAALMLTYGIMLDHKIGSLWFLEFYLVAGMFAAVNHVIISAEINRPDDPMYGSLAALTGCVFLLALILRNRAVRFLKYFTIEPGWIAGLLVAPDMMGLISRAAGQDYPIGHGGHIAAAFLAMVYYHKSLRRRVWRKLTAVGIGQELLPVQVKKLGWIIPCEDEDIKREMVHFFDQLLGMSVANEGKPLADMRIKQLTKFRTPHGSLTLVEPDRGGVYHNPVLSFTVDNLVNACKNLDSRKVQSIAPLYHLEGEWAIVHYKAADGRIYEIKGPFAGGT
jgi:membrane associated rhomboid family serine protease